MIGAPNDTEANLTKTEEPKMSSVPDEVSLGRTDPVVEMKVDDKDGEDMTAINTGAGKAEDKSDVKETIEVEDDEEVIKSDVKAYRERKISSASSASSEVDSEIEFSSDTSDSDDSGSENVGDKTSGKLQMRKKKVVPCVKGELFLEDLDPIVDLQISVPENKVEMIGKIINVVGCLVTIESFEKKPALDLNTVLFIEEGRKAIGHIFEVFGRTSQPYYCVRFNSPEHVKERGVEIGTLIYAAPGTEHTRYVFLAQLERLRGTDASWKDDHEAPNEFLDYSDDETEKIIKNKNRKPRPRKNIPLDRSFPPDSAINQDITEDHRLARKRNFNHNPGFGGQPNGNRFGPPRPPGFAPPNAFGAPGPFRPTFAQHCYRPMVPEFANSQDFYGAPRYGSMDPYGNHRFGPPPANPFSVGGAAVTYRPPYENSPNGWMNYNFPRNHNPGYWHPPPNVYPYDYQAAWAAYQYQSNLQPFTVPVVPQPPPPPPQPIVGAPVLNKDVAAKTSA
ncbi:unnamed protein product [Allacma fusca]|uniref:H/ACA ribonucleoprotein complex non-core subunit NAF1 n=1 Tax=Allacma fusca TaxID=39272 RepID=A0A8J2J953_9HEXA|nr:unnamed protein product [Allacma fusca]